MKRPFTLWARDVGEAFLSPIPGGAHLLVDGLTNPVGFFLAGSVNLLSSRTGVRWQPYYMERRGS